MKPNIFLARLNRRAMVQLFHTLDPEIETMTDATFPQDPNAPSRPSRSEFVRDAHFRKKRLSDRAEANAPWPTKKSDPECPEWPSVETGRRVMIRAAIANAYNSAQIRQKFEIALCEAAGRFTALLCTGGWRDPSEGALALERGGIYEISIAANNPAIEKRVIQLIREFGRSLGEDWVHIERHEFDALHTQTSKRNRV